MFNKPKNALADFFTPPLWLFSDAIPSNRHYVTPRGIRGGLTLSPPSFYPTLNLIPFLRQSPELLFFHFILQNFKKTFSDSLSNDPVIFPEGVTHSRQMMLRAAAVGQEIGSHLLILPRPGIHSQHFHTGYCYKHENDERLVHQINDQGMPSHKCKGSDNNFRNLGKSKPSYAFRIQNLPKSHSD